MRGDADSLVLKLPWPPSVNTYWRKGRGGRMHISAAGKAYLEIVGVLVRPVRECFVGPVAVEIWAFPPDRRTRDLDNIHKALFDALAKADIIEDDVLVQVIHSHKAPCDERAAGVVVMRVSGAKSLSLPDWVENALEAAWTVR